MLNAVRKKHSRSTMSIINAALNKNIREAEAKAEIMMSRRDPYNSMTKEVHQDWFFTEADTMSLAIPYPDGKLSSRQDTRRSFRDSELKPSASEVERSEETMSALRGHLPHYLTSSGSVLSASLEVNEKLVCCVPGERSKSMQERQTASTEDSPRLWHSAMPRASNEAAVTASTKDSPRLWHSAMTRASNEAAATTSTKDSLRLWHSRASNEAAATASTKDSPRLWQSRASNEAAATASTKDSLRLWQSRASNEAAATASTKDSLRLWHSRASNEAGATEEQPLTATALLEQSWQPLTTAALLEHTKVTQIPVKGMGCLAHGQYSMWKPDKMQTSPHH